MRQGLFEKGVKPQFAGHETFPLRLLWLKKAHDAVAGGAPTGTFVEQEAIATFGVGRNMAASMRHWAVATGFVTEGDRMLRPTPLGNMILADEGLDPYLEAPATTWLAHWHVASTPEMTTTAYFAFNGLSAIEFDPDSLATELMAIAVTRGWRATRGTLKRDVETFLRSYVRRRGQQGEDAAEPLLAELGMIREARLGGWYEFVRGPKATLPDAVFAYALDAFWRRHGSSALTAEQISYAPGSPGRVFKLDEDSIVTRLMALPLLTAGAWGWTDTAGLRQVQRVSDVDTLALLPLAYGADTERKAAA
ncbi:MAG: DUF4007 family protein [Allosphingosinicella sp.]